MDETKPPGISIGQIFLSRAHFSHRPDYLALPANAAAGTEHSPVKIQVRARVKEDGTSGLIAITVTSDAEDALYRYEIEMVGLVYQDAEPNMPIRDFLARNAPTMMYPFVREAVANLTLRGRFGPSWLRPFNWKAVEEEVAASANAEPATNGDK